jgi:putative RecB family exonuclease
LAALDAAQPASALADAALAALHAAAWLQTDQVFTAAERRDWERAFTDWRRLVRELEDFIARGLPAPGDWDAHLDALTDQVPRLSANGGLRLVPLHLVNGVRARHSFVLGLSENAAPRRAQEMQLIKETDLPQLFTFPPSLPLARHHTAWIEREARGLAAALSRGSQSLWLSTSRFAATGDAQLPSPFFERLLGPDGAIDREGGLVLHTEVPGQPVAGEGRPAPTVTASTSSPATHTPTPTPPYTHALTHASASQLRAYLTCPLQYFYQRILGLETEGSGAMDRGGLIHELLCVVAGDGGTRAVQLWDRPRPAWFNSSASLNERALAALEAAWRGQPVDLPGGGTYTPAFPWGPRFGPDLQRQAVRRWVERLLARWADYEVGALGGPRRPVLLETEFEFGLGPYRLRGRIDRIDEVQTPVGPQYEVIDYKTGRGDSLTKLMAAFLPSEGDPPSDYQLPIYALALMRGAVLDPPIAPRRLHLLYVQNMEPGQRGFSATARRTFELTETGAVDTNQGRLPLSTLTDAVVPAIQSTLDQMSRPPWPAQPGRYCDNCSFRAACDRAQAAEAA